MQSDAGSTAPEAAAFIAQPGPSRASGYLQLTQHALVVLCCRCGAPRRRSPARGVRVALRDDDFRARLPRRPGCRARHIGARVWMYFASKA